MKGAVRPLRTSYFLPFLLAALPPPLGFLAPPLLPGPLSGIGQTPFRRTRRPWCTVGRGASRRVVGSGERRLGEGANALPGHLGRQLRAAQDRVHSGPVCDLAHGPGADQQIPEPTVADSRSAGALVFIYEVGGGSRSEQDGEIAAAGGHVQGRCAEPRLLPIDDAHEALARPQQVARPVVAVQQ